MIKIKTILVIAFLELVLSNCNSPVQYPVKNNIVKKDNYQRKNIDSLLIDIHSNLAPDLPCCFELYPKEPISPFISNSNYKGFVILSMAYDTMSLRFKRCRIVLANLHSKVNIHDSIFCIDKKCNNKFLEEISPKLYKYIKKWRLIRILKKDCDKPTEFLIHVNIE